VPLGAELLPAAASRVLNANPLEPMQPFTSAFKELDPIPQFKATAKLGEFFSKG